MSTLAAPPLGEELIRRAEERREFLTQQRNVAASFKEVLAIGGRPASQSWVQLNHSGSKATSSRGALGALLAPVRGSPSGRVAPTRQPTPARKRRPGMSRLHLIMCQRMTSWACFAFCSPRNSTK